MKLHLKSLSIITAVLLVISLFFNIVLAVSGDTFDPGSDQDPLVSKSYVDSSVANIQQQFDALKKSYDELSAKADAQDQTIKDLQEALKNAGTKTGGTSGGTQNSGTSSSTTTNSNSNTTTTNGSSKGTVNTAILNVRSQANTTATILAKAAKGESVTILSKSGDWYKIKTSKNVTGWVLGKYLIIK